MFGFSKSDLSRGEATYLLLALLHMHVKSYVQSHQLMESANSSLLIKLWLQRHGRRAGFLYRAKMSTVGDTAAVHFLKTYPKESLPLEKCLEMIEHAVVSPEENPGLVAGEILILCKDYVIKQGL